MTTISLILDRSGSMITCQEDTIKGFNTFLNNQKEVSANGEDTCLVSLYQFDNEFSCTYEKKNITEAETLDEENFKPRGHTALYDAIGHTLAKLEYDGNKNIVVIITDGEDNSSIEYSAQTIRELVEQHKEKGTEFVFIGANQDVALTARNLNINVGSAIRFDVRRPENSFNNLNTSISRSRRTGQRVEFTQEEVDNVGSEDAPRFQDIDINDMIRTPMKSRRSSNFLSR